MKNYKRLLLQGSLICLSPSSVHAHFEGETGKSGKTGKANTEKMLWLQEPEHEESRMKNEQEI